MTERLVMKLKRGILVVFLFLFYIQSRRGHETEAFRLDHEKTQHATECQMFVCKPGTIPSGSPCLDGCTPCWENTYMDRITLSTEKVACLAKRKCLDKDGFTKVRENDRTKDRICRCLTEWNYFDPNFNLSEPEKSPEECKFCRNESSFLDQNLRKCADCAGTVQRDAYDYKRCIHERDNTTAHVVTQAHQTHIQGEHDHQQPTSATMLLMQTTENITSTISHRSHGLTTSTIVVIILAFVVVNIIIIGIIVMIYMRLKKKYANQWNIPPSHTDADTDHEANELLSDGSQNSGGQPPDGSDSGNETCSIHEPNVQETHLQREPPTAVHSSSNKSNSDHAESTRDHQSTDGDSAEPPTSAQPATAPNLTVHYYAHHAYHAPVNVMNTRDIAVTEATTVNIGAAAPQMETGTGKTHRDNHEPFDTVSNDDMSVHSTSVEPHAEHEHRFDIDFDHGREPVCTSVGECDSLESTCRKSQ